MIPDNALYSAVYIASDVRSGSTMLDLLLGNHPDVTSIGELHFMYEGLERHRPQGNDCTCGVLLSECPFWSSVCVRLFGESKLPTNYRTQYPRPESKVGLLFYNVNLLWRKLHQRSEDKWYGDEEVAERIWDVYDAIHAETQCRVLVDSSKRPEQYSLLYLRRRRPFKVIYLVRDGRGVTNSKAGRSGRSVAFCAASTLITNLQNLAHYVALPASMRLMVWYEELCINPEIQLKRICRFVGIPFHPQMLELAQPALQHNIGGSPRRFDSNRKIKLDDRWKTKFTAFQKGALTLVLGPMHVLMRLIYHRERRSGHERLGVEGDVTDILAVPHGHSQNGF